MKLSRVKDYKAARTPEDKEFLKHEVASDTADHLETIAKALSKVQVAATGEDGKDGEQGEKGDPGERGEDGKQGIQGPSGKDSKDGRDGFDGRDGRDGLDGRDGENGKDGSPDSAEDTRNKLELLDGEERLDAKFIKNLGHFVKNVYNQVEHIGGSILDIFANGSRVGGAGALDIIAGSNVTISSSFDGNKAKVTINASSGASLQFAGHHEAICVSLIAMNNGAKCIHGFAL